MEKQSEVAKRGCCRNVCPSCGRVEYLEKTAKAAWLAFFRAKKLPEGRNLVLNAHRCAGCVKLNRPIRHWFRKFAERDGFVLGKGDNQGHRSSYIITLDGPNRYTFPAMTVKGHPDVKVGIDASDLYFQDATPINLDEPFKPKVAGERDWDAFWESLTVRELVGATAALERLKKRVDLW